MGIVETLSGQVKVLTFEIRFDDENLVGVEIAPLVSSIASGEYIRLWACYFARIVYNAGYPTNELGTELIASLAKAVGRPIEADSDLLKVPHLDLDFTYTSPAPDGCTKYRGEYYAKGFHKRTVKTWFPLRLDPNKVVASGLVLMQKAVDANRSDPLALSVFTLTARTMLSMYMTGDTGFSSPVRVPNRAYIGAVLQLHPADFQGG